MNAKETALKALKKAPKVMGIMILLLLLHLLAMVILDLIDEPLKRQIVQEPFCWGFPSGMKFSVATFAMMVYESFAVSFVGAVLIVRHGWWCKKLLLHTALWYAVYLVVSLCIIHYEGKDWNILWSDYYRLFTIENSIFPLIVILIVVVLAFVVHLFTHKKPVEIKEENAD